MKKLSRAIDEDEIEEEDKIMTQVSTGIHDRQSISVEISR